MSQLTKPDCLAVGVSTPNKTVEHAVQRVAVLQATPRMIPFAHISGFAADEEQAAERWLVVQSSMRTGTETARLTPQQRVLHGWRLAKAFGATWMLKPVV